MRGEYWILTVLATSLLVGGCGKKRQRKVRQSRPVVGRPNDKGVYEYRVKLPDRYACQTDADCWYTHLRPGNCCPDQCDPKPASRKWLQAVKAMHYPTCRPWLKTHGFDACGRQDCPTPKGYNPKPKCVDHRCTLEFTKLKLEVHRQVVSPPPAGSGRPAPPPASEHAPAGKGTGTAQPSRVPGLRRPK